MFRHHRMSVRGTRAGRTHWLVALGKSLFPFVLQFLHWMIEGKSGINLGNMRRVTVPPFVLLFGLSEVINIKHLGDCLAHSQRSADISSGGGSVEPLNMHHSPRGPGESVRKALELTCTCQGSANVHSLYYFYYSIILRQALDPLYTVTELRNCMF